jgi:two-component system sensor histidine kinase RegB
MVGQVVTILTVQHGMAIELPLKPLFALIAVAFATNLTALYWTGGQSERFAAPALMILDTIILTALLYFTGGPFNPFSFLYLVQIALAAVVLPSRYTWTLVVLSLSGSAFLFFRYRELALMRASHEEHMRIHLIGMWVAFGVAAAFIVYFLRRITRALARRDAELVLARHLAARQERMASLATLAAGTAHELATPLSTIAIAARELDRELLASVDPEAARNDARLIRQQVQRCRAILDRMSMRGGEFAGECVAEVDIGAMLREATTELSPQPAIRIELPGERLVCSAPPKALTMAVQNLLKNAQDASHGDDEVVLRATRTGATVLIEVSDRGQGMTAEVLDRVGEPFFTTKPAGSGMGLGLFVSRSMVERLGGHLRIASRPHEGTRVSVELPLAPDATTRRSASAGP